jgi:hypothetical protein
VDTPGLEIVDVDRGGRWSQVLLMEVSSVDDAREGAEQVRSSRAGLGYVGIVSADLGTEAPGVLEALRPGLQEIVCFDSLAEPGVDGQDFAMTALEKYGFGQDFVFTVPVLEDAVDYAVDTLVTPGHHGWEGSFVVVVGPRAVIERAQRHLTEPGAPGVSD